MMFIEISIGGAPSQSSAGCANVHLSCCMLRIWRPYKP
jgi:hypothetical protein